MSGDSFTCSRRASFLRRARGRDDDRVPNGHPVVMLSGIGSGDSRGNLSLSAERSRLSGVPFTIIGSRRRFFWPEIGPPGRIRADRDATNRHALFENLLRDPIVSGQGATIARTSRVLRQTEPPHPRRESFKATRTSASSGSRAWAAAEICPHACHGRVGIAAAVLSPVIRSARDGRHWL